MSFTKIRRLSDEYADDAHNIALKCFSSPWSVASFVNGMNTPSQVFFGIFTDNSLAGYISAMTAADDGEILSVAVLPEFRRHGFASLLLEKAFDYFKNKKTGCVFLEVRQSNEPAQFLYEKFGFVKCGIRKNYYSNPLENAILYEKKLR